jgi:hypothetical protein
MYVESTRHYKSVTIISININETPVKDCITVAPEVFVVAEASAQTLMTTPLLPGAGHSAKWLSQTELQSELQLATEA